jgi:NAD(P)-dependent dehydrogenase (short-subunit alcohol dehydrogenase family)
MTANMDPALANPLSLFDVSGQVVVITGASGALGRVVAIALGSLKAKLLLVSGSTDALEAVAAEVRQVGGAVQTLVRRPDSLEDAEAIVAAAADAFGQVDSVFVASGYNKPAPIEDMSYEDWQDVMDANVRGPWLMAKVLGAHLKGRNARGRMLLVSSVRGRHGNAAGYSAYSTSKGATDALTRVLATEWGKRGINVNAIAPAVFRSALTAWIFADDAAGADSRARNHARIPLGRLGEPEDFIGAAIYLLSPASDFVTGQILYVDGGYTAG